MSFKEEQFVILFLIILIASFNAAANAQATYYQRSDQNSVSLVATNTPAPPPGKNSSGVAYTWLSAPANPAINAPISQLQIVNGALAIIPPVATPVIPATSLLQNVKTAETNIISDTTIPTEAKLELSKFFTLLNNNLNQVGLIQTFWQDMISAYSSTWLTSAVQTSVENYFSKAGLTL